MNAEDEMLLGRCQVFDVVVVGSGLMGLSAAWDLSSRGFSVLVIDSFEPDHSKGSSHGRSRILRSVYDIRAFAEFMHVARTFDWPRLQDAAGVQLLHPTTGCFFGPRDGLFDGYVDTVGHLDGVERLPVTKASIEFPQFKWEGMAGALKDRTSAVIDAQLTMKALSRLARGNRAAFWPRCKVTSISLDTDPITLHTKNRPAVGGSISKPVRAKMAVVTAGAWVSGLFPELASHLGVVRQHVGFFSVDGWTPPVVAQDFPVWAYLGLQQEDFFYGLPDIGGHGLKAARHRTRMGDDNADETSGPSESELQDLEGFLRDRLTVVIRERLAVQTCLYTNTIDETFIIDRHPDDERVVVGAGFSGHGFKFGPLVGRILSGLCSPQKTPIPTFEEHRHVFRWPRL